VSLRVRLVTLFAALVLVVVSTAAVVVVALQRVEANRTLIGGTLGPASVGSRALLVSLIDQETGQRGFMLTGDDAFLEPYDDGIRRFATTVGSLRRDFAGDAAMTAAIDDVAAAARTWRRVGASPEIDARRAGDLRRAQALVATGAGKAAFDRVRARVGALQDLIDARTRAAQERDATDLQRLRTVILLSRTGTVLLVLVGAVLLRRWVLLPVQRLRARMRTVAGGAIDDQVLVEGPPEVAAISEDAESMRRRIVAELEEARAATEALRQHSPVVALLRRGLVSGPRASRDGVVVAGAVLSAEGVLAGDWWQAVERPDGTTALVVADVSGHGAEAGLVAYAFKQRITALLDTDLDLGAVFDVAARRTDDDHERFLSCLVVAVDAVGRRVSWVNAGHPPALVVDRNARDVHAELAGTGPLVTTVTSGWTVRTTLLGPDDMLVVCTDGVLEARGPDGEEFGSQRLLDVVRGLRRWKPEEAVAEVQQAVRRFALDVRRDDVTVVALTLDPRDPAGRPAP
jgi:serine phosphatase RsbU (regulator of sigma subunit)/CHASE3 domain sensor protein